MPSSLAVVQVSATPSPSPSVCAVKEVISTGSGFVAPLAKTKLAKRRGRGHDLVGAVVVARVEGLERAVAWSRTAVDGHGAGVVDAREIARVKPNLRAIADGKGPSVFDHDPVGADVFFRDALRLLRRGLEAADRKRPGAPDAAGPRMRTPVSP